MNCTVEGFRQKYLFAKNLMSYVLACFSPEKQYLRNTPRFSKWKSESIIHTVYLIQVKKKAVQELPANWTPVRELTAVKGVEAPITMYPVYFFLSMRQLSGV